MSDSANSPLQRYQTKNWLRYSRATTILAWALAVLATKVFVTILAEYRFYFPANFQSTFLLGREASFPGVYAVAFYTHLIVAPITLVLAVLLVTTGWRPKPVRMRWHRIAGRLQAALVVGFLVPSGLVMATRALAGPIAGAGFVCLSLATGLSVTIAAVTAIRGRMSQHRRWAIRALILLCSPLLLRFLAGAAFVLQNDTPEFYRFNAWASWIVPLAVYEVWCFYRCRAIESTSIFPRDRAFLVSPFAIGVDYIISTFRNVG